MLKVIVFAIMAALVAFVPTGLKQNAPQPDSGKEHVFAINEVNEIIRESISPFGMPSKGRAEKAGTGSDNEKKRQGDTENADKEDEPQNERNAENGGGEKKPPRHIRRPRGRKGQLPSPIK